ncbi:MAG: M20/M25/M40 family metallo-hydrolase [Myxococcales bacterium]|nr:M20/M25/M40 family metallo-hydrolase [Myxococcales bacterium]
MKLQSPTLSFETLVEWGTRHLEKVIAIDSQSDASSDTIPSTESQLHLAEVLSTFFRNLGMKTETDELANVIVTIPSNLPEGRAAEPVAMMVHIDTAEGTQAVPYLLVCPKWDGSDLPFPKNKRLHVSVYTYPSLGVFLGDDVLYGPGDAPVGLDDKLGMAELMTFARVLAEHPEIHHGDIFLIFRPDEEIGRMDALESLADTLVQRGVRYGYTIDGLDPFEVNTENFNASRVVLTFPFVDVFHEEAPCARRLEFRLTGVKTHGATAKVEGYRNAILMFAKTIEAIHGVVRVEPVYFQSDHNAETHANIAVRIYGDTVAEVDDSEKVFWDALASQTAPHESRGAFVEVLSRTEGSQTQNHDRGGLDRVMTHIQLFLDTPGPMPVLSEESDGYQGYSNPFFLDAADDGWRLSYRVRDFDPHVLLQREEHIRAAALLSGLDPSAVETEPQYVNMGPALADYPELADWAFEAARAADYEARRSPIRGGTGVDPFLRRGIPVANLGTGYFAPESEKELTSRQNIARHTIWLCLLVQVMAQASGNRQ